MAWLKMIGWASFLAALHVALGAFGAHALQNKLTERGKEVYATASQYHMFHALGLLAVGLIASRLDSAFLTASFWLISVGVCIFSGSLYGLAITQIKWLGAITPIGGVLLILGWLHLMIAVLKA